MGAFKRRSQKEREEAEKAQAERERARRTIPDDARDITRSVSGTKKYIALYFSAHWCGPCRHFTPKLAEWYSAGGSRDTEIVFVSSDKDAAAYEDYFKAMPWLALPFNPDRNAQLRSRFGVQGIPTLIVFDGSSGALITDEARDDVENDPATALATWTPQGQSEKVALKEQGFARMKAALPAAVEMAMVHKLRIAHPMGEAELREALQTAAQRNFGRKLSSRRLEEAVQGMLQQFGDDGQVGPASVKVGSASVQRRVAQMLAHVWSKSEVELALVEWVPEIVCGHLEEANKAMRIDEEWEARTPAVQQCIGICEHFAAGAQVLDAAAFERFLLGTEGETIPGLFDYLVKNGEGQKGVTQEQVYCFVYHRVFATDLIARHHEKLGLGGGGFFAAKARL